MEVAKELLKFEDREVRKNFINTVESGIYFGKNVYGEEVIVFVDKGKGMDVYTKHHEKPRWWEVIDYDEVGFQESVSYIPEDMGKGW